MPYSITELFWLFLIYSLLGWIMETAVGTVRRQRFINPGFTTGPFCPVYGVAAVMMAVTLQELSGDWLFLFLGSAIIATAIEWFTGKLLEKLSYKKWWDYSKIKWNFDGYICLPYSVLWGILGVFSVRFSNHLFIWLYRLLPGIFTGLVIWGAVAVLAIDLSASAATIFHIRKRKNRTVIDDRVAAATRRFGLWIEAHVERRMEKAYPLIFDAVSQIEKGGVFAEGCGFYKLFWLFFIGALLGDGIETVFCRITAGVWMSRSSLVWGPFSIVWGFAIAVATALLYRDRTKPDRHIFVIGTVLGGAYEYICSVLTELVFGKVFWDYSAIPFNLGGRINLLYCFFWGIVSVIWIKGMYPFFSRQIERIPKLWGYILTWVLVVFMTANMLVSSMALIRSKERSEGKQADNFIERYLDEKYGDDRLAEIYPNALDR